MTDSDIPFGTGPDLLTFSVQLFSALAHPTRLRIIELLTMRECTVNELAAELKILQPNASQHLAILNRAGVVKVRPDGVARSYSLRGPDIARVLSLSTEFWSASQSPDGDSDGEPAAVYSAAGSSGDEVAA